MLHNYKPIIFGHYYMYRLAWLANITIVETHYLMLRVGAR